MVEASIYDEFLQTLQQEGGYLVNEEEKELLASGLLGFGRPPNLGNHCPPGFGAWPDWRALLFPPTRSS